MMLFPTNVQVLMDGKVTTASVWFLLFIIIRTDVEKQVELM